MDKVIRLLGSLGVLLWSVSAYGQSGRVVQGMLMDTESRPIAGALVRLIAAADTMATSSSQAGFYTFGNVRATSFKIVASSLGFQATEKQVEFPEGEVNLRVPSFVLAVNAEQIEEVVIDGVLTVQVKGDTVEYSTKDLKLREGAVAEEALKKLQGVEVDKDGNVTAQGESITKVRINGKDFFGGDVKTATQNLPANIIEKIQVVDDYGDMANLTGNKSGDSEKVLNIQIDPEYNKGYMTTLRAGYGTEDRYQATAMWMGMTDKSQVSVLGNLNNINAPLFDFNTFGGGARRRSGGGGRPGGGFGNADGLTNVGSIGLNIRHDFSETLKVYGSYSFGRDDNKTLTERINQYTFDTGVQEETNASDANNITASHRFEANIEWNISDKDYVKITPQFGFNDNRVTSTSFGQFFGADGVLQNQDDERLASHTNVPRYGISGLYNRRLSEHGRNFFMNFNYDNSATASDYDRILDRLISDPNNANTTMDEIYQRTLQEVSNKSWNAGATFSYIEPLSEHGKLEVTYDFNTNAYDNRRYQDAFDEDGNTYPNDDVSIVNYHYDQDFSFSTHRIGANYAFENDKVKYSVGAAVQPSLLQGWASSDQDRTDIERKNFNVVPIARFEYKFSRQKNISIHYSGRSNEPSVDQILPYVVSLNETNKTYGNPNLNPEFRHNMNLRFRSGDFQKGNTFFAFLNAELTNDKIVSFVKRVPGTEKGLLQETRYLNESEPVYGINSFYHYGKSLKEKTYNIMVMGGIRYNKNVSYTSNDAAASQGAKNIANNWVWNQGLMFRYNPSEKLELNPGIRYAYNYTKSSLQTNDSEISSWTPTFIGSVNITPTTIFGADVSKTFNRGYGSLSDANPFVINTYIEQRFLPGDRAIIRLQAFDLLNEQMNLQRTVQDNYYSDTWTNRLGRYFMLTFTFKLQKFSGINPAEERGFPGGMRRPRM